MVAYLQKSEGSEGFHQIIDFLNASHIQYALTENPTIYVSFIKQFWKTATTRTSANGEVELTATIDGQVKTITEASLRRHLKLEDNGGITTLPNSEIFEQLALMGYVTDSDKLTFQKGHFSPQWKFLIHTILHCLSPKKTAWEQFSSNIATAIICLATNRTYNFSKLIFDAMIKNLENPHKFLMYPRFIQIWLNKQRRLLQPHTRTYPTPILTQKVFSNMKRVSRGYSGIDFSLFPTMISAPETSPSRITSSPSLSPQHTPKVEGLESKLKQTKQTYSTALTKLILRVNKLEQIMKARKSRRRARVVESDDEEGLEDPSKQGRKNTEIDQDPSISLVQDEGTSWIQEERYQTLKKKPVSVAQARKNMMIYLKNMAKYKMNYFKGMSYDEIRTMFKEEYRKLQTLFKKDTEVQKTKRMAEETLLQASFKKLRRTEASSSEPIQEQSTEEPKELSEEALKKMLEIALVEETKAEALQIIRVSDITEAYQNFIDMLKGFDREDLVALWSLVKERFRATEPTEDMERALWVELKRLFEPDKNDVLWKLQRYMHDPLTWRLYSSCGVHHVSSTRGHDIYMLTEKDYPLSTAVMGLMLSRRLQVEEDSEMARDLIMKIFTEANKPRS
ncbi:hypothetical protein Tco_0027264 [Tanacetum coccineum]